MGNGRVGVPILAKRGQIGAYTLKRPLPAPEQAPTTGSLDCTATDDFLHECRVLPETYGPSTDKMPDREPASEVRWLEPYPNSALEGIVDRSAGPDARYEMREAVQLAFIATIQLLPARICTEATHLEAAPERFSWEWAAMLHAHEAGITATRSGRPVNLEWQLSSADPCQPQSAPRQASDVAVFAKLRQEERRAGYGWTDSAIQLRYSLLPSSMVTAMHSGRS